MKVLEGFPAASTVWDSEKEAQLQSRVLRKQREGSGRRVLGGGEGEGQKRRNPATHPRCGVQETGSSFVQVRGRVWGAQLLSHHGEPDVRVRGRSVAGLTFLSTGHAEMVARWALTQGSRVFHAVTVRGSCPPPFSGWANRGSGQRDEQQE